MLHIKFAKFPILHFLLIVKLCEGLYRQNRCYSCMSARGEVLFDLGLKHFFNTPKNFTDQCNEPMQENDVELVSCRTICLTVYQDLYVWGHTTGERLYVRGCAVSITKRGISNHTLSMLDRRDICREMSAADLFRYDYPDPQRNQRVHVCSCLGDRCNGALSSSGFRCTFLLFLFPVMAVFALFR